ncbi:MAG: hypothetical protein NTY59_13380 [Alphaproteobacteria bacterium]|nr:hypothetical protein [Alphaproteobacteria bacterium]
MRLTDFDVLTFDIIGTLIDFESGILNWIRPRVLCTKVEATDQEMLEAYARAQSAVRKAEPKLSFSGRTPKIWAGIAKEYGIEVQPGDGTAFLASARNWPAFPDSVEALAYLKRNYRHLVAVTNGDRVSARAMAQTLGSPISAPLGKSAWPPLGSIAVTANQDTAARRRRLSSPSPISWSPVSRGW